MSTKMSPPSELSFDEILKFMLAHNGKVTNHELVKHFKMFLMNPDMRDEARNTFKKHVNSLAIIKNQNNEKWLILKKKYLTSNSSKESQDIKESKLVSGSNTSSTENEYEPIAAPPVYRPPPPVLNQDLSVLTTIIQDAQQPVGNTNFNPNYYESVQVSTPTPITTTYYDSIQVSTPTPITTTYYDSMQVSAPTPITTTYYDSIQVSTPTPITTTVPTFTPSEDIPPKVHPRRRSSDKSSSEKSSSIPNIQQSVKPSIPSEESTVYDYEPVSPLSSSKSESMLVDDEHKISVKERKQMFNRMASEGDVMKPNKLAANYSQNIDDEDRLSLDQKENDPLDPKQKQWILSSARGEYHVLAKMCKENPKLAKTKDPFTGYTAMHWACKRGDENLVKLLAGVARHIVNERSNGGYTPLHIAMQFRHENVYRLLVEVYDADPNMRDWSGRKPRQYLTPTDTSLSPGMYRKKESFLRIGSLNVRVKKTTEAFSNFLGVGATRSSTYMPKSRDRDSDRRSDDGDQLHKSWGSADNIQKEDKLMPPPSGKVKRRGASGRKGLAAHSRSTPSTPDQARAHIGGSAEGESDSDSAAGFHSAWRQQRASCT